MGSQYEELQHKSVADRLAQRFGDRVDRHTLDAVVEADFSRYADARIRDFLPLLVERDIRERMVQLGLPKHFGATNPFAFMDLQDVQEVTNFFERRVSAYQVGVQGEVAFDEAF